MQSVEIRRVFTGRQELKDADAPAISLMSTGTAAVDAGLRDKQGGVGNRLLTLIAQAAGQSLGDNQGDGRGEVIEFDAHLVEPGQRAAVREPVWSVDRTKCPVCAARTAAVAVSKVPYLTDHDDVRDLGASARAESARKPRPSFGIYGDLIGTAQADLYGVLYCADVASGRCPSVAGRCTG